jgi:adenosine deaminase
MDLHTFLRRIPKVELHLHLGGAVRGATFVDLARKHDVKLPPFKQPEDLWVFHSIFEYLPIYRQVCETICDREDYRRTVYEALEDGHTDGMRYCEMFWNPHISLETGVKYGEMIDGMIEGIRDAEVDFGVQCFLIAEIPLYYTSEQGLQLVKTVLENRRDELIGIGMDYGELGNPPEKFTMAYRMAKEAGLHRTAHTGQITAPANIETCLDVLGCERVDHGYSVVLDDRISRRCASEGIVFTVTPSTTQAGYFPWDMSKHPIREMISRGIKVVIGADDPTLAKTTLGHEYVLLADHMGYGAQEFQRFVLNGIDGSWLDESTKRDWRKQYSEEIELLAGEIEGGRGPRYMLDADTGTWSIDCARQPGLEMWK